MNKKLLISLAALVLIIGVAGYSLSGSGLKGQWFGGNNAAIKPFDASDITSTKDAFLDNVKREQLLVKKSIPSNDAAFKTFKKGDKVLYMSEGTNDWHAGKVDEVVSTDVGAIKGKIMVNKYNVLPDSTPSTLIEGLDVNNLAHTDIHPTFNSLKIGDVVVVKSKAVSGAYYSAKVAAQNSANKTILFEKAGDKVTKTNSISASNVYIPGGIVVVVEVKVSDVKVGSAPEITSVTAVMSLDGKGNGNGAFSILPATNATKENTYLTNGKGKYYFNYEWKITKEDGSVVWDKSWHDVINGDDDKPMPTSECYNNQDIYSNKPGVDIDNMWTCAAFTLNKEARAALVKGGQGKYVIKVGLGNGDSSSTKTISYDVLAGSGYALSQLKYIVLPVYDVKTGDATLQIEVDSSQLDTVPWQNGGVINVTAHTGGATSKPGVDINMLFNKTGDFNGMPTGEVCMSKTLNAYVSPCIQKLIIPVYDENGKPVIAPQGSTDYTITVESKYIANIVGNVSQQLHFKNNGKPHFRIEPIFGKNADNTDKVGFGYSYCNQNCSNNQVYTNAGGNDSLANAYQVIKITNDAKNDPSDPDGMIPSNMSDQYYIRLDGTYQARWTYGDPYETISTNGAPLLTISGLDIAKYSVASYDYSAGVQVPAPANFPAPGKSITLYIPTVKMSKLVELKSKLSNTGYGKPDGLSIYKKNVPAPLASY